MAGEVARLEKRGDSPPGYTETEIRDGEAVESTRLPRKGNLYTRSGELHLPLIVNASDGKTRVGDCVIRYDVCNPAAMLPYLDVDGSLQGGEIQDVLSADMHAKVAPQLCRYSAEDLPGHGTECKALVQRELYKPMIRMGLRPWDTFIVWDDKCTARDLWDENLRQFYKRNVEPLAQDNRKLRGELEGLQKELEKSEGRDAELGRLYAQGLRLLDSNNRQVSQKVEELDKELRKAEARGADIKQTYDRDIREVTDYTRQLRKEVETLRSSKSELDTLNTEAKQLRQEVTKLREELPLAQSKAVRERETRMIQTGESDLRELARRKAEQYAFSNPWFSGPGEAAFWVNTYTQLFYDALAKGTGKANG